ncbi:hypothetical protein CEXT_409081 [Caerostris extrusa]|uniref:Uncharacterized protein n=1 Tax=Caerostris extrusa TaxID=172846 RepID=A0AAV4XXY1_CAEEX|nr:hypothetical protein CEXT_409081 [Caerostris extrusa]
MSKLFKVYHPHPPPNASFTKCQYPPPFHLPHPQPPERARTFYGENGNRLQARALKQMTCRSSFSASTQEDVLYASFETA